MQAFLPFIEKKQETTVQSYHRSIEFLSLWHSICNLLYMKQLYVIIFFLFISFSYGQSTQGNGEIEGFNMYPNPVSTGKVYISTTNNDAKEVLIYDVLGTLVLKTTILGKELHVADLDAGVYVLRVFEKDKVATRKLIIK